MCYRSGSRGANIFPSVSCHAALEHRYASVELERGTQIKDEQKERADRIQNSWVNVVNELRQ